MSWYANGVPLLQRRYDETVSWKDMKGVAFTRTYRPPAYPQHITFSMWSDQDQDRAFGGKLEWDKSPFTSQFKDLRWGRGGLCGGATWLKGDAGRARASGDDATWPPDSCMLARV